MRVYVEFWSPKINKKKVKVELTAGSSILNLFDALADKYEHFGEEFLERGEPKGIVFVNETAVHNWKKTLKKGDEVNILPVVAGG